MNEKTLLSTIKTLIQTISGIHDNSVIISAGANANAIEKLIFPVIIIKPKSAQSDPETGGEAPQFLSYNFSTFVIVRIANDSFGETPIMGTANQSGLLDICEDVSAKLVELGYDQSVIVQSTGWSQSEPIQMERNSYIVWRELGFRAYINT